MENAMKLTKERVNGVKIFFALSAKHKNQTAKKKRTKQNKTKQNKTKQNKDHTKWLHFLLVLAAALSLLSTACIHGQTTIQ